MRVFLGSRTGGQADVLCYLYVDFDDSYQMSALREFFSALSRVHRALHLIAECSALKYPSSVTFGANVVAVTRIAIIRIAVKRRG